MNSNSSRNRLIAAAVAAIVSAPVLAQDAIRDRPLDAARDTVDQVQREIRQDRTAPPAAGVTARDPAIAAGREPAGKVTPGVMDRGWGDRARIGDYRRSTAALEAVLPANATRDEYAALLQQHGYRITAVNEWSAEEIEWEVVKGNDSWEVQIDFDDAGYASNVDVGENLWRADATERAMRDPEYAVAPDALTYDPQVGPMYRDRGYVADWNAEMQAIESRLPIGQRIDTYTAALRDMGYTVTAVNDREPDYVELEIVKGRQSYEVQMDRDPRTGLMTAVDVTNNLWEADATEQALERNLSAPGTVGLR